MQPVVKRIIDLLDDDHPEKQHAAAIVLGHIGIKERRTVDQIAARLSSKDAVLQRHLLESLLNLGVKEIGKQVSPLLDSRDETVRALAMRLLAEQGRQVAAELAKELEGATLTRKRVVIGMLAQDHRKENLKRLIDLLHDEEVAETIINTLRHEMNSMSVAQGKVLQGLLTEVVKSKSWQKRPEALAHAVQLLGYHRDAKLVSVVMPFTNGKVSRNVRLAAIGALRRPLSSARSTDQVYMRLLPLVDDDDLMLARAAIETLKPLTPPADATKTLTKLSDGVHADARGFALRALGRSGGKQVVKTLVDHVKEDDPTARKEALRALTRVDGQTKAVVQEMKRVADNPEVVKQLVNVLIPAAAELAAGDKRIAAELAYEALSNDLPTADDLSRLVRAASPKAFRDIVCKLAANHRRAKRHGPAFTLWTRLERTGLIEDEERYLAFVSGLQTMNNKKTLGKASRSTDPVLRHLVALVDHGFPVATKLKRERLLTSEDLFFVGFNFCESRDEDEKELGGELLEYLVDKSPRSKLGRSAKNKLRLVGLYA